MENKPIVTIILPIYNAEKYLQECIESILNQTYPSFVLLIIDDGSIDQSARIIKNYVMKDSRIVYFYKENEGVSIARNFGIEVIRENYKESKYTYFIDADDYIESDMIELLVNEAETNNTDMVMCNFYYLYDYGEMINRSYDAYEIMENRQYALTILKKPMSFYYGVVWNKLYKTKNIYENRFTTAVDVGEDFIFNLSMIPYMKRISILSNPLYHYRKFNSIDTLTNKRRDLVQSLNNRLVIFEKYKKLYLDLELYDKHKNRVLRYMIASIFDLMFFEKTQFRGSLEQIQEYRKYLECIKIKENYLKEMTFPVYALNSVLFFFKTQLLIIRHYYRKLRTKLAE